MPLTSGMVSRRIDSAQKKREEFNFEIRKNLLEYDEVMDEQRKRIYGFRQNILNGVSCRDIVLSMVEREIEHRLTSLLNENFGSESFAAFASSKLSTSLDAKSFRKLDFTTAQEVAIDEAERNAEGEIVSKIDENLPEGEDESEWNWEALARFANSHWELGLRDRDLMKVGRERVDEFLVEKAREAIKKIDLSEAAPMLEPDYHLRVAASWLNAKFSLKIDPTDLAGDDRNEVKRLVLQRVVDKYDEKEAQYPVMAGMYHFIKTAQGNSTIDREGLVAWAKDRFKGEISLDDLKGKQRQDVNDLLIQMSQVRQAEARGVTQQLGKELERLGDQTEVSVTGQDSLSTLANWLKTKINFDLDTKSLSGLTTDEIRQKATSIVADHFHPEMRRMERMVLLDVVDSAWKDHLLAMDYLLAAVRQRGMAALDPKVEYKREGMRMFKGLWQTIDERVTDLIFRMERLNEDFVNDTWVETSAVHSDAATSADMARQQQVIDRQASGDRKVETIRNRQEKVGRNDPCPCGSGKKYKVCCLRKEQVV
ncbi:MAG TPA: SEC-C metal-binding domain-containing protein [Pirellulaceae bacterium]|nr:SEC-C metal-binding domain-containing protein [Pirellulaceae bacterium]HMO93322.1 SEC-C metal-binding domain-containing protein [Pirellulaceae bacterium]